MKNIKTTFKTSIPFNVFRSRTNVSSTYSSHLKLNVFFLFITVFMKCFQLLLLLSFVNSCMFVVVIYKHFAISILLLDRKYSLCLYSSLVFFALLKSTCRFSKNSRQILKVKKMSKYRIILKNRTYLKIIISILVILSRSYFEYMICLEKKKVSIIRTQF